jgi:secreted Zn-dependent insulinase-like peptidase
MNLSLFPSAELIIPRSVEKDIKKLPRQLQKLIANEHLVSIQSGASLLAMLASPGLGYGLIRFLTHSGKNASCMINSCAGSHLTDGH